MGEKKQYRSWTVEQKLEIVLAGLRGDRSVAEICRERGCCAKVAARRPLSFWGW